MGLKKLFKRLKRDKSQFNVEVLSKNRVSKDVYESIKRIACEYKHLDAKEIEKIIYNQHKIRVHIYTEPQNNRMYVVI